MAKGKPAALKGKADNDKLNNEKDPNKRIKLILDKKKDEFKMPNSCLDVLNTDNYQGLAKEIQRWRKGCRKDIH